MNGWLRGPRDRVALTFGGRAVRYGELARAVGAAVLPRGSDGGRLVAVAPGTDPVDTIVTLLACLEQGRPVAIGADASTAAAIAPQLPPGTELALMTSGSSAAGATVVPRAVARTNASWLASAEPLAELLDLVSADRATPVDRIAVTGPLHVSMHLYAALHALWLGATATDDVSGADLVHATPTRLARLLDSPAAPPHVVVAGAATGDRLRSAAAARDIRISEYYGAAELSFVAAGSDGALTAFPGVEIELREVSAGRELWARSPYLALGAVGGGMLRRDDRGFATVGDLAATTGAGAIRILGRGDAAITTAGQTVLAEDVEARLAELPGIAAAAVLGEPHELLGERLVAVVELEPDVRDAEAVLAAAVADARRELPAAWLPRSWHLVDALPRTISGKLARGVLRAALAAGSLQKPGSGGSATGATAPPAHPVEEPA